MSWLPGRAGLPRLSRGRAAARVARRQLWVMLAAGLVFAVSFTGAVKIHGLTDRAEQLSAARLQLARVQDAVPGVRRSPEGMLHGQASAPSEFTLNAALRDSLDETSAELVRIWPTAAARRIRSQAVQFNGDAAHVMMLISQHRLVVANEWDAHVEQAHNDALDGTLASTDTTLKWAVAQAVRETDIGIVVSAVGSALLLTAAMVLLTEIRRRSEGRLSRERALAESDRRFRALVHNSSDMITVLTADGTIAWDSPAVERLLGWAPHDRIGTAGADTIHPDDRASVDAARHALLADPSLAPQAEYRRRDAWGQWRWVEATAMNMLADPAVGGIVTNHRIIDDRKAYEHDLQKQALHDPLTGCANRTLFRERVSTLLASNSTAVGGYAVLYLDLDEFKAVNDGLGHAAGDAVLVAVGQRLREAVRANDLVARLGGDEFAILIERTSPDTDWYLPIAQRMVDCLGLPIDVDGQLIAVAASVGVAILDPGETNGPDEVLRAADVAMYTAKAHGKGRFEVFAADMLLNVQDRLLDQADLHRALAADEFELHYQPIVRVSDSTIVGMEALIRWRHPARGLLSPAAFMPLAEDSGIIIPLGRWILTAACRQLAIWRTDNTYGPVFSLNINISPRQLHDPNLVEHVRTLLADQELDASTIVLEITETVLMQDPDAVELRLRELKALGVQLAIDDFGTGYSSLSHLKRFPIDELKIDKTFIDGITGGPEDQAISKAVLKLAEAFGIRTVAEGVETVGQHQRLLSWGCPLAQGYLFGRPQPAANLDPSPVR